MNIIEIFRGTDEERAAKVRVDQLSHLGSLNARQKKQLEIAQPISRRLFMRRVAVGAGSVLLTSAGIASAVYINRQNRTEGTTEDVRTELAQRLHDWRFPKGRLVSELFPEVDEYRNLLVAPSLPLLRSIAPIRVYYANLPTNTASGQLELNPEYNYLSVEDKDLRIEATKTNGEKFSSPIVTKTSPEIRLASSLRGTNAELVVLAKEMSQVYDFLTYCRKYRQILEAGGNKFSLINNKGVLLTQDVIDISIGMTQMAYERQRLGRSYLGDFIDEGSFLRIGAILYANWRRHFSSERSHMPTNYISGGDRWTDPLVRDRVITLQGDFFYWAKGQAPDVGGDLYQLWGKYGSQRGS